jgi:hypothetical protein
VATDAGLLSSAAGITIQTPTAVRTATHTTVIFVRTSAYELPRFGQRSDRLDLKTHLQTPHVPPSFAQCRQYLQFLQAWQGSEPVQVAECKVAAAKAQAKVNTKQHPAIEKTRDLSIVVSSNRR